MIPVAGTLLLGIPMGTQASATSALPWPNGSLISAQIIAVDAPNMATIMIGAYRMQAKVPPNTPLGQIWLELMNRELPAQLRILAESRALEMLVQKIAEKMQAQMPAQLAQKSATPAQALLQQEAAWPLPQSSNMPFHAHVSADQERVFLEQADDQTPRGMMQKQVEPDRYALHGRLDLDELGTLFFMLEQHSAQPMHIKLRAANHQAFLALQEPFRNFLDRQNSDNPVNDDSSALQGRLFEGREPFIRPTHQTGSMA